MPQKVEHFDEDLVVVVEAAIVDGVAGYYPADATHRLQYCDAVDQGGTHGALWTDAR